MEYRIEHDTMGEVRVPKDALHRAQTQRAVENFPISGSGLEPEQIIALARIQPTVTNAFAQGKHDIDEVTELHVQDTIDEIMTRSKVIREAVEAGKLGVVGANYKLALGEIHPIVTVGTVE